nr:MAG: arylesterase [Pseudomonadota bacterium]
MVNGPSGLLTCFVRFSALRTTSRLICAWALGIWLSFVAGPVAAATSERVILVLGDSLSAAYGIRPEQGWVALLEKRLQSEGYGYRVVNASVSGETSTGGVQRLPRALELHKPEIVILELGANDGLRGLPLATTRANLEKSVELARAAGAKVLLVGLEMPPNYGPKYTAQFREMFRELAKSHSLPLVPFLLENVALDPELMQSDGLHPNAKAQPILLDNVWPLLKPLLAKP